MRLLVRPPFSMHVSKPPSNDVAGLSHRQGPKRCVFGSVPGARRCFSFCVLLLEAQLDEQARPHDDLVGIYLLDAEPVQKVGGQNFGEMTD